MEQPANFGTTLPLHDIITPTTVSSWPPAIGWWLLLLFIVVLLIAAIFYYRLYKRKWSYRKLALKALKAIIQKDHSKYDKNITAALLTIVKRTSMTIYPDSHTSTLEGSAFLSSINQAMEKIFFSEYTITNIDNALYSQKNIDFDIQKFYQECCLWIKQHPMQLQSREHSHV